MRLFVALTLPAEVTAELEAFQQRLQRSGSHPVKWVAPAAVHLTLQFLGEVPEAQLPAILAALARVRAGAVMRGLPRLFLAPVGAFPNLRRPQTLWMGVDGDLDRLAQVHQAVNSALEPLGFAAETRPFRAHLTLGRVRREASPSQRVTLGNAIAALPPPGRIAWQSAPPTLFQSTLTPDGAMYRELGPA